MTVLKVNDKNYKVKFGYKALAKSGALKEVALVESKVRDSSDEVKFELLEDIFDITAKLLLAGLQKYHSDEFGCDYDIDSEMKKSIDKVYDFLDDYNDEEEHLGAMELFSMLVEELMENGFLSEKSEKLENSLTEVDSTVIPMDHKSKKK